LVPSRLTTETEVKRTPKVILGDVGEPLASDLAAHFARRGWRTKTAANSDDARRAAAACRAYAVILPVESFAESGFLACAKLVLGLSKARVVLVGPDSEENERFALFAGAAGYVTPETPVAEVARIITGRMAPTAN